MNHLYVILKRRGKNIGGRYKILPPFRGLAIRPCPGPWIASSTNGLVLQGRDRRQAVSGQRR